MNELKNSIEMVEAVKKILTISPQNELLSTLNIDEGIEKFLNIVPNTHYEGNGGYTSKEIQMEGGDFNNDQMTKDAIEKIFGRMDDKTLQALKAIRTDNWTRNWKKNLNFTKEFGGIASTEILPYDDRTDPQRNRKIAALKTIPNEEYTKTINKFTELGATKEDMEELLIVLLGTGHVENTNKILNILIDDIGIKDPKRLIELRMDKDNPGSSNKLFHRPLTAENLKKNIEFLKSQGVTDPEAILQSDYLTKSN